MNAPRKMIWFLDTSSLLSMAVNEDIEAAVLYPEDAAYLLGESSITHHEVADVVTPEV